MVVKITKKPSETYNLGVKFSKGLKRGDIIAFYGGLGAGKTHLIKGICKGLNVKNDVISPSFTIVNEYDADFKIYHIDFYRIETIDELGELGFEEYLYDDGICLIEWADKVEALLPERKIDVKMEFMEGLKNWRKVSIEGR